MVPTRPILIVGGLLLAVFAHVAGHSDTELAPSATPQSPPSLSGSVPRPPPLLPSRAPDATVRAATASYTHMPPADHPRRVETLYRAETLAPAMNAGTASSWQTTEYNAQPGLGRIKASTGYAVRSTGKPGGGGITVAVVEVGWVFIDDAERPGHPDLRDARIVDISGRGVESDHSSGVAGIAAARRNAFGMHGVAYNANIGSLGYTDREEEDLEAALASVAGLTGRWGPNDANEWDSNPAASAHIANFSFAISPGSANTPASITNGMKLMAREGRIMTAALGNGRTWEHKPDPRGLPASAVADAGIAGHAIAVGMLHETNDEADDASHRCGAVRRWCIFAPGDGYAPKGSYSSTTRVFGSVSGTSFAAPHVAGALAAVWAAFPNKTGAEIVQRILDTARQVDPTNGNYDSVTGLSPIYGHGALDLGAALDASTFN